MTDETILTGPLSDLQALAHALVNGARGSAGLVPLTLAAPLCRAAQGHAEMMTITGAYGHTAPDGSTPQDRIRAAGARDYAVTGENIARIDYRAPLPTAGDVHDFQAGWMGSPSHRDAILSPAYQDFGFGIAGAGDRVFAVQTFGGAGAPWWTSQSGPPPLGSDSASPAAGVAATARRILQRLNEARTVPLAADAVLDGVAASMLPPRAGLPIPHSSNLFGLLPLYEQPRWERLEVHAASCTACGAAFTEADADTFAASLLAEPMARAAILGPAEAAGQALVADGLGAKTAVIVLGRRFH